jgi:hypothetical protein
MANDLWPTPDATRLASLTRHRAVGKEALTAPPCRITAYQNDVACSCRTAAADHRRGRNGGRLAAHPLTCRRREARNRPPIGRGGAAGALA